MYSIVQVINREQWPFTGISLGTDERSAAIKKEISPALLRLN